MFPNKFVSDLAGSISKRVRKKSRSAVEITSMAQKGSINVRLVARSDDQYMIRNPDLSVMTC